MMKMKKKITSRIWMFWRMMMLLWRNAAILPASFLSKTPVWGAPADDASTRQSASSPALDWKLQQDAASERKLRQIESWI